MANQANQLSPTHLKDLKIVISYLSMPSKTYEVDKIEAYLSAERDKRHRHMRRLQTAEENKRAEIRLYNSTRDERSAAWRQSVEGKAHQKEHEKHMKSWDGMIANIQDFIGKCEQKIFLMERELSKHN